MSTEIQHTWHFDRLPKEVWNYLTQPELLVQWLGQTDFQPIVGTTFSLAGKSDCLIHCKVLEVVPYSRLVYSWQTTSIPDHALFNSTVEWILIRKGNGTELQLTHKEFSTPEDYNTHDKGWLFLLTQLTQLFTTNI